MACKNGNCCRSMPPEYDPPKSDFDADDQRQADSLLTSRPMKAGAIALLLFTAAVVAFELAIVFFSA